MDNEQNQLQDEGPAPQIFERSVQDHQQQFHQPGAVPERPGAASRAGSFAGSFTGSFVGGSGRRTSRPGSHRGSVSMAPAHHTLEDLVAPALDASATLVTDSQTDLDNVEMIYSDRNSTLGLDRALGRTRTNSNYNLPQLSRANSNASAASMASVNSNASGVSNCSNCTSTASDRPRILRFYSYADMISDENAQCRRPSVSHSASSTLLRGQSPQPSFTNPFHGAANRRASGSSPSAGLAAPPLRSSAGAPLRNSSRSPSTRVSSPTFAPVAPRSKNKFTLESSGSDCSTSEGENDDESDHEMATSPSSRSTIYNSANPPSSQTLYNTVTGPRLTRTTTQNSFNKARPTYKTRTYSSASSVSPFLNANRALLTHPGPAQNMNDVLFDDGLQINTVSDVLRKKISNADEL
ncbi:LAME_0D06304g1_1 [Lachancea meyersii CBS 8951]|uniref:LAME_0D06304g1_1 n=1 Tax=Lachancea meyersii CBS 8951 TaxID=1266667 RepID=A0A1G4J930_9SACH|nr:LAME_0D06304g1_1 [Lachancea meyersii CBS 8951]